MSGSHLRPSQPANGPGRVIFWPQPGGQGIHTLAGAALLTLRAQTNDARRDATFQGLQGSADQQQQANEERFSQLEGRLDAIERFFRLPDQHPPGSGLGLAIVSKVLEEQTGIGWLRARVELLSVLGGRCVGVQLDDGRKVRVAKLSGEVIDL